MKRATILSSICLFTLGLLFGWFPNQAKAAFNKDLLIDDVVFTDSGSMGAAQIDAFLDARSSCISPSSGFSAPDPIGYNPSGGFLYGGNVSAGNVIAHSAQVYGLNPQVLIVTLQKEQSLITSTSCSTNTISKAMGYGCPDSGGSYSYSGLNLYTRSGTTFTDVSGICVNGASKTGFTQQTIRAAWLLKFSQERSLGNINWAVIQGSWDNSDDLAACYSGYMTQGTFKRCPNGTADFYDGWATIDGTATHMDTGATASLYRYTPHFAGNQNFVSIFESWFGPTISAGYYSCRSGINSPGLPSGAKVIANRFFANQIDRLSLTFLNNTGSTCVEAHNWQNGLQGWITNVATNHPAIDPADGDIVSGNMFGDNKDELMFIKYRNTGSGYIEVHTWDPSYQKWSTNIATNHPAINPSDGEVIVVDGPAYDKLMFVKYQNTGSGRIEIHAWNPGYQNWSTNIATNLPSADPSTGLVTSADTDGNGWSELMFVKYQNTGSGRIEIHAWNPGYQNWSTNIATNLPSADPADALVTSANLFSDGRDEVVLVKYRGTGSGRIEVHVWNPGYQSWMTNIATNHPSL